MHLISFPTTVVILSSWMPHYPQRPLTLSPYITCSQTSPLKEIRRLFLWTRQEPPPLNAVVRRENNDMSSDNSCIADELALLMDL